MLIPICFTSNSLLDDSQKGPKSHLEILAEMRDYKRRRQSYRAKNVHITKKSYTEVSSSRESCEFIVCLVHISINNGVYLRQGKISSVYCALPGKSCRLANKRISLVEFAAGNYK